MRRSSIRTLGCFDAPQNAWCFGRCAASRAGGGRQQARASDVDSSSLRHALSKNPTSLEGANGKLFDWAIGSAPNGDSLAGGDDPETSEIETDRPDYTQNRKTVGRGVVQLESGMTYLQGQGNTFDNFSFPETLLRVGVIADWLELRIGQNFASDRTNLPHDKHHSNVGTRILAWGSNWL